MPNDEALLRQKLIELANASGMNASDAKKTLQNAMMQDSIAIPPILPVTLSSNQKKTKKTKAQTAKDIEVAESLVDQKPPPTYYNSYEGSIKIDDILYHHDEIIAATGKQAYCPRLTNEQWAFHHEKFPVPVTRKDPISGLEYEDTEDRPAIVNKVETQIMDLIDQHPRVLILAFRDARKSTAGIRITKRAIADRHKTVSYFSSTSEKAVEFSEKIREQFFFNETVLRNYGYFVDDKQTNRKDRMFWLFQREQATRQPGLTIGSVEGKSQMGGHPDIVILDDPIGEDMASEKMLKMAWNWFTKQIAPMAKSRSKIIVIGTMKHPQDLYNRLMKTDMFQVFILRAIETWPNKNQQDPAKEINDTMWYYTMYKDNTMRNEETRGVANIQGGKVGFDEYRTELWGINGRVQYYLNDDIKRGIDKNRMSMQEFLLVRKLIGRIAFEYEYQLNPMPVDEGFFQWDQLHWFDLDEDKNLPPRDELFANTFAFFDQSFGSTNRADLNAIAVVSKVLHGTEYHYYVLDLICWQGGGVKKKEQMISEVFQKWPFIQKMGVEGDQINTEDCRQIIQEMPSLPLEAVYQRQVKPEENGVEAPQYHFEIPKDIPSTKHSKIRRIINNLDTTINLGRLFVSKKMLAREEFDNSKSFPYCEKFDPLDAVSSAKYLAAASMTVRDFGWEGGVHTINSFE